MAAKDGANVGVAQDSGKRRLAPEFEHGQIQHGWYRRVVQGGMVPSGAGVASSAASQSSCSGLNSPWWKPGTEVSKVMTRSPLTK